MWKHVRQSVRGHDLFRVLSAVLLIVLGSGCVVDSLPDRLSIPKDDPSFRSRLYGGALVGNATLSPNTGDTVYRVKNDEAVATQIRLGVDLHSRLSLELDSTMLGSAELNGSDAEVQFASLGASALIYGLTGQDQRSRREGLSGYLRLGFAGVKKASVVQPLDGSDSGTIVGIGAEYGFGNGVGLRFEATQIDDEAVFVGMGAVYRLGMPPRAVKDVLVAAASAVPEENAADYEPQRSLFGGGNVNTRPSTGQGLAVVAPTPSRYDLDGDGIKNKMDACDNTALNVSVDRRGCGLFDRTLAGVSFKPGSYSITPESRLEIKKLAETLKSFPEVRLQVQAHTDSQGDDNLNNELSRKRAGNVVDYLIKLGIPRLQLSSKGMGSRDPIASNDIAEGRAINRRISLLTLPNLSPEMLAALSMDAQETMLDVSDSIDSPPKIKRHLSDEAVVKLTNSVKYTPKTVVPTATAVAIVPMPPSRRVTGLSLSETADAIEFESTDSAELKRVSRLALQDLTNQLNRFPQVRLSVHSHIDERDDEAFALSLTERRAAAIVAELVSLGIPQARLNAEGYGSQLPIRQALSEADRVRNRRIEFRVIP